MFIRTIKFLKQPSHFHGYINSRFIYILVLVLCIAGAPTPCNALTIDEVNTTLTVLGITSGISVRTIVSPGTLKNLVVGGTIYDVDFIKTDMYGVWGPISYDTYEFESPPMFWLDVLSAIIAADVILEIMKDPLTGTYRQIDNFFIPFRYSVDNSTGQSMDFIGFGSHTSGTVAVQTDNILLKRVPVQHWDETSIYAKFTIPDQEIVYDRVGINLEDHNSSVPEPSTLLLFGIGLLGLAGVSRRKK